MIGKKIYERALFLLGLLLLIFCSIFLFTDLSIRRHLLGLEEYAARARVGFLKKREGGIRRRHMEDTAFNSIDELSELYNNDTIVTGSSGSATVELDDGSTLELGPNTMIRLAFDSGLKVGGIFRQTNITVIAGQVIGKSVGRSLHMRTKDQDVVIEKNTLKSLQVAQNNFSKADAPPQAAPQPQGRIEILAPRPGTVFDFARGTQNPEKQVSLIWKVSPRDSRLQISLKRVGDLQPIYNKIATPDQEGRGTVSLIIRSPGKYEWTVKNLATDDTKTLNASTDFQIQKKVEAIELLSPLVSGQEMATTELKDSLLSSFDIQFRWKPYPKLSNYTIHFFKSPLGGVAVYSKTTQSTQFRLKPGKVFAGHLYYQVTGDLPNGFLISSQIQDFRFDFMPPMPKVPRHRASYSKAEVAREKNRVLFTWQKTNFTEGYHFELSKNSDFSRLVHETKTNENFALIDSPGAGRYFWRVTSLTKETRSAPSPIFEFTIQDR